MPNTRHRLVQLVALVMLIACSGLVGCNAKSKMPDRQSLYVNCSKGEHLLVYEINKETGKLTEVQRYKLEAGGGPLAVSDDGKMVYSVIRPKGDNPARVIAMSRDAKTGKLTRVDSSGVPTFPTYLDIDKTGKFAVTASYGQGVVHTFKLGDNRSLIEGPIQTTQTDKTAHASLIDPTNRFVYIPHTTPNGIYQFRFDDGYLRAMSPLIVTGGGKPSDPAGPRHYAYHPKLSLVYFVNELDSSVSAYAWDQKTGQLARFQSLTTLPGDFTNRNTCADIHITPDGKFLYASNRGHDSIAAYKLDEEGRMTFIDWFKTEPVPREFAIDLTGRYLYSLGLKSHKLAAYAIDSITGRLIPIGTYDTPEGPIWVEPVALD